ncbi:MAG: lipid disaccharide synthase [Pseudobdellovibrio sp.]|jgi:lipid-A-disaccharide synthase|nr:lipid disaccharide synthase [Pseudobdellovibrio sp.]
MMIAAEASSAHYALKLMQYWKSQNKDFRYFGVGSSEMEAAGFERLGKSEEMAVVGIAEIVAHYSDLKAVFNNLVEEAIKRKPKVLILMDYPDFNFMLAKKLQNQGINIIYYISPQVWAWRKSRIKKIKKYCQKVLLLFPFEVDFYKSHDVPYEFVGHPLLDELNPDLLDTNKIQGQKEKYGIKSSERLLALMPGSRRGELDQHLSVQLEVAKRLLAKHSHLRLAVLVAPTISRENMLARLEDFRSPYILLQDDPYKMISMADYVLVASGTATLMVGLLQKPMVIMYRVKWLTALIARAVIKGVKYFGLVNLIMGREVVPERMQEQATAEILFNELDRYITDEAYTQKVVSDLKELPKFLGSTGATARVASAIESYL